MRKLTTGQFILDCGKINGGKYDYSKVVYVDSKTKVEIICPVHGPFLQLPNNHRLLKQGCPDCGLTSRTTSRTKSNSDFISKVTIKHNDFYNYSKTKYTGSDNKIEIICTLHGSFWQTAGSHLGGSKCPSCAGLKKLSTSEFISRSKKLHQGRFTYNNTIYVNSHTKLTITCEIHGDFAQEPTNHLFLRRGCPKCAGRNKTTSEFIEKSNIIHRKRYNYSMTNYINCLKKVTIICGKHGEFDQLPGEHLKGKGCSKCTHIISKPETQFLDYYNIPLRNHRLPEWRRKPVDGFDPESNTVFEFLGDYWHGNPDKYKSGDMHPKKKVTYSELLHKTMENLNKLKSLGYTVKYIWEKDWNNFVNEMSIKPNIITI